MRSTTCRGAATWRGSSRKALAVATGAATLLGATSMGWTTPALAGTRPSSGQYSASGHTFVAAVGTVEGNVDPLDYDSQAHQDYTPLWAATLLQYRPLPA